MDNNDVGVNLSIISHLQQKLQKPYGTSNIDSPLHRYFID